MSRKRYPPEQIIGKRREAEMALARGETAGQVCRTPGIAEQAFSGWRREYGGLRVEPAKRLTALEQENVPLRRDATYSCHILVAKRASCKTVFSVILNEVKDLNRLKIRDSSLHSE